VFALVELLAPVGIVGSVTGAVGAAGPWRIRPPLVMGAWYGAHGSSAVALTLLAAVAPVPWPLAFTASGIRQATTRRRPVPRGR